MKEEISKSSRRAFLENLSKIGMLTLLPTSAAPALAMGRGQEASLVSPVLKGFTLELGPMLGHVSSTEALIWAKASENATLSILIGQKADLSDARIVKGPALTAESAFMEHVQVTGLEASKQYYYAVLLDKQQVTQQPYIL